MSNRFDEREPAHQRSSSSQCAATYSSKSIFNSVAAGYVAGICGVVVGHPLDSIKVLLQTNPCGGVASYAPISTVSNASSAASASARASGTTTGLVTVTSTSSSSTMSTPQHSNMSTVASNSARVPSVSSSSRSIRALYAGMTGPLLTIGLLQSTYFAMYDSLRRVLHHRDFPDAPTSDYLHNDSLSNVAYAAALAGAATTIITSPLMVVKTKQQIMVWGFRKAVMETMQAGPSGNLSSSLRNFYVGFVPHFFAVTAGRSVYMTVYEILKRSISNYKCRKSSSGYVRCATQAELTLPERVFSASAAGMACWAAIFPLDVIQNKMYQQTLHGGQKTSRELTREMYRTSGGKILPFFRGFGLTVLRAGPVAAVVLPVYDMSLDWLSSR